MAMKSFKDSLKAAFENKSGFRNFLTEERERQEKEIPVSFRELDEKEWYEVKKVNGTCTNPFRKETFMIQLQDIDGLKNPITVYVPGRMSRDKVIEYMEGNGT